MKKAIGIFVIILLTIAGCGENKQSTYDLITVDVSKSYPKKELILQDFLDVEYIPLETTDEFVNQGVVLDIGRNIIIVKNNYSDGNIFIYDRNGEGLRKINRKGNGGEEYTQISKVILDESNDEIFVQDYGKRRILVYDFFGTFKRSVHYKEGVSYGDIYNFDNKSFICKIWQPSDNYVKDIPPFAIVSKQDGSFIKDIQMSINQIKSMRITDGRSVVVYSPLSVLSFRDSWILLELSSDTVFKYLPDNSMTPFIARTPSIESMNPEIFLLADLITDNYYFMRTIKNEYNFETNTGFQSKELMFSKQEKTIFEYTIFNDDFSTKNPVNISKKVVNKDIGFWQKLEAHELVAAYKAGELKGQLKDIAAKLDEEDNPVIMLAKHKK